MKRRNLLLTAGLMVAKPRSGIMNAIKLLAFLFLLAFTACEKWKEIKDIGVAGKDWTTLPPETQTGAHSFGCYVNGELFVSGKDYFSLFPTQPQLRASFLNETKILRIYCTSRLGNGDVDLFIDNARESEYNVLSLGYYTPTGTRNCWQFGCDNCGQVFLTKLDTVNRIVSGTFEFSGKCCHGTDTLGNLKYTGDSIVQITKGRFDIELNITNQ